MTNGEKSQILSRNWLPYIEAVIVLLFISLILVHTRKGETESDLLPLSEVQKTIKQANQYFAVQDLAKAAIAYWQAIRAIESAKKESPGEASHLDSALLHVYLRVAEIYSHGSWVKDARKRVARAEQIQPEHIDVYLLSGKLLREDGEKEAAVEKFRKVIEKEPNHAEAHYLLGVLYQSMKKFDRATEHYKKAIESDAELVRLPFEPTPIGLQARLQLSRTYRRMLQDFRFVDRELTDEDMAKIGQLEAQSVDLLEEVMDKDSNHTEATDELIGMLYARAAARGREGETRSYDKALEVYTRITELDPNDVDAWNQIGEINRSYFQDAEAALKAYRKAYELSPDPGILAEIKNLEEDSTLTIDGLE